MLLLLAAACRTSSSGASMPLRQFPGARGSFVIVVHDSATNHVVDSAEGELMADSKTYFLPTPDRVDSARRELAFLDVPIGNYLVSVRRIGYMQYTDTVRIAADHTEMRHVTLRPWTVERAALANQKQPWWKFWKR